MRLQTEIAVEELFRSIFEFSEWTCDEVEDKINCKKEMEELQIDLKQIRTILKKNNGKSPSDRTEEVQMYDALVQMNEVMESANILHEELKKNCRKKNSNIKSTLSSQTKSQIVAIADVRKNLRKRTKDLLSCPHFHRFNQVSKLVPPSSTETESSCPLEMKYEQINFKKNSRGSRRFLGSGSFSVVYDAIINDQRVAVKYFHFSKLRDESYCKENFQKSFYKQLDILFHLYHPNVVEFVGSIVEHSYDYPVFIIITEYLSENITEFSKKATLGEKIKVILGMLSGLSYLHSCGVIHRNIKPEHIMLSEDHIPKFIGFGLSKKKEEHESSELEGTFLWMSPEKRANGPSTFASDMYSLGLVIAHSLTGKYPNIGCSPIETYDEALKDAIGITDEFYHLVLQCLNEEPNERPSVEEMYFRLKQYEQKSYGNL